MNMGYHKKPVPVVVIAITGFLALVAAAISVVVIFNGVAKHHDEAACMNEFNTIECRARLEQREEIRKEIRALQEKYKNV